MTGLERKNGHRICVNNWLVVLGFEVNGRTAIKRAVQAVAVVNWLMNQALQSAGQS
jgi:hypothetical protein